MKQEKKEFIRELLVLALPVGLQNMINSGVTLVDNVMIGSLGDDCISAVSVSWTYSWLFSTVTTAFASGALVYISRLWGENRKDEIKKIMSFALAASTVSALILFALTALFPAEIMRIYSDVETIIPVGVRYLRIMKYTFLANTVSFSIMILLRSIRVVKVSLFTSMGSCLINVVLNYLLIYGHFGFPTLGIEGAAIASLCARLFELGVSFVFMFIMEKELAFRITDFEPRLKKETLKTLVTITIPLLVIDFLATMISTVQTIITGHISQYYISANSIVHTSWEMPNIFCWGIMQAANVMIGNIIGSGDYGKAFRFSRYFAVVAIIIGAFTSIILHPVLALIMPMYNVSEETVILANQMSWSASLVVIFSSYYTIVGDGVLKAGGNTKRLLKIDLLFSWLVAVPAGAICAFILHWPAHIIYIILRASAIFKSVWATVKLAKRDWIINI